MTRKFLLILFIALSLVVVSTIINIGVTPDSMFYIGVAKSLAIGNGLTLPVANLPLAHWPPLYPLILSLAPISGFSILHWALLLNLVSLASSLVLANKIALQMGQVNPLPAVALIAFSPATQLIHTMVWSEPLFILFSFGALSVISIYFRNNDARLLWLSAALAALGWLERYVGISVIAAICGGIWLFSSHRLRNILIYFSISTIPMLAWMLNNQIHFGVTADRNIHFCPITLGEGLTVIAILVSSLILYILLKRKNQIVLTLLILFIFSYTTVLALTICLVDPSTPIIDYRILSPILFACFLLLPWLVNQLNPFVSRYINLALKVVIVAQLTVSVMVAFEAGFMGYGP